MRSDRERERERDRDRERGRERDRAREREREREREGERTLEGSGQRLVAIRDRLVKLCDGEATNPSPDRVQEAASFLQQKAALDSGTAKIIVECAAVQCNKVPIYAALVGLLNAKHPPFGQSVLDLCSQSLRLMVEPNVLRFVAELRHANVLSMRSLTQLLCRVKEEGPEEILLLTLPWAGWGVDPDVIDALLSTEGNHDAKDSEAVLAGKRYLRAQVQALRSNEWECDSCIARVPFNWLPHDLELPSSPPLTFARPRVSTFRCFSPQDSEKDLVGCDRMVTECYVLDVCQYFAPSLSLAVDRLLQMMPVKFRYDFVMVETLLGQMLAGTQDALFFHAVLSMMLRNHVKLAGVYFRAVDTLFRDVGSLDPDARQRFVEWFAVHLSNFAFKWEWGQWVGLLEGLPDDHPRILFLRAVLGRCVRLSYWARVEKSLPPSLAPYMPPYPKPVADLVLDSDEQATEADVRAQQTLLTLLRECTTFSQLKGGLRKHGAELRQLANSDDAKLRLLRVVGRYWANSEGNRLMVADVLLGALVVDQAAVVSWVFSEHSAGSLISYAPWEVLHMAVGKTVERTKFLQQLVAEKKAGAEAKLETQLREQKDLFLTTFQRFVIVLESYLAQTNVSAGEENSWFHAVLAQMVAFGNRYRDVIRPFVSTLQSFVFSEECDPRVRAAFNKVVIN